MKMPSRRAAFHGLKLVPEFSTQQAAYFGVSKFVLCVVNIDGSQQFFTGFLAVHKLALWNSTGIQHSVPIQLNRDNSLQHENQEEEEALSHWHTVLLDASGCLSSDKMHTETWKISC